MKWTKIVLAFLLCFTQIKATTSSFELEESFLDQEDEAISLLESEIQELLDEDIGGEIDLKEHTTPQVVHNPSIDRPAFFENQVAEQLSRTIPSFSKESLTQESLPVLIDSLIADSDPKPIVSSTSTLTTLKEETAQSLRTIEINLKEVFAGSPVIYFVLLFLSVFSLCIWLYSMLTVRSIEFLPPSLIKDLRTKLIQHQFEQALDLCVKQKHFFCKILASGILARKHGLSVMIETMKTEGKRSTISFWQRLGLLNEVAVIAPMLGLLGTVLGMFYAFYDLNRSMESISLLFDGLGISVGTTVAGLIVAILAMILHSIAKYRLVRILASVENEVQSLASIIDTNSYQYLER